MSSLVETSVVSLLGLSNCIGQIMCHLLNSKGDDRFHPKAELWNNFTVIVQAHPNAQCKYFLNAARHSLAYTSFCNPVSYSFGFLNHKSFLTPCFPSQMYLPRSVQEQGVNLTLW